MSEWARGVLEDTPALFNDTKKNRDMNQQEKQKTEKRKYIVFISYKSRYSRERKSKRWMGDSEEEWLKWAEEWLHKYMGADVYLPTEKNNFNLK